MRVVAIAGDAGGARAVAPVIAELLRRAHQVECRAYGPARRIWEAEGYDVGPVSLDLAGADRAVLGTSAKGEQHELKVIAAAARLRVRTVSVLDSWVHYRERFLDPDGNIVFPDAIAVMDRLAQDEAVAAGLPLGRLVVTGQPAFDALEALARVLDRTRATVRRELGIANEIVILFVSQPLRDFYSAAELGFDPRTVLPAVTDALAAVLSTRRTTGRLLVKLHPRELGRQRELPRAPGQHLQLEVVGDRFGPRELVVASDLVVGMNSILLMEACLLRMPALAYQPGLRIADPLPANRLGWTAFVTDPAALAPTLDAELFDPVARRLRSEALASACVVGGAAARVADLVLAN